RHGHPNGGAGAPCQFGGHQARDQLDQARRAGLELLAHVPRLRRQESGEVGILAGGISHANDRRMRRRLPAYLATWSERGLVVPGATRGGPKPTTCSAAKSRKGFLR